MHTILSLSILVQSDQRYAVAITKHKKKLEPLPELFNRFGVPDMLVSDNSMHITGQELKKNILQNVYDKAYFYRTVLAMKYAVRKICLYFPASVKTGKGWHRK